MRIALDFDGTITKAPPFWEDFVSLCITHSIEVCVVTARPPRKAYKDEIPYFLGHSVPIIFTSGRAKKPYCSSLGEEFDIWIDDNPWMVHLNPEELKEYDIQP